MKPLDFVALFIMAVGFITVFAAKTIVKKYNLAEKQTCEHESEMSDREIESYKLNKAIVGIKKLGLLISIPGMLLLIFGSKL